MRPVPWRASGRRAAPGPRRRLAAWCLLSLLGAPVDGLAFQGPEPPRTAPAAAERSFQPSPIPSLPAPRERPRLAVSVKDSLLLALRANFEIQIERTAAEIAVTDIQKERGEFNPNLSAKLNNARVTTRDDADFFANKSAVSETLTGVSELTAKLPTGTGFTLTYDSADTREPPTIGRINTGLSFKVTQALLKGFGFTVGLAKIRVAEKGAEQARTDFVRKVLDVLSDVQLAYWDLYRASRTLDIRREAYTLGRTLLESKRVEVELGNLAPVELIDIEADLASRVTDVLEASRALEEVDLKLRSLLNLSLTDPQAVQLDPSDAPLVSLEAIDLAASVERALKLRPEYQKVRLQGEAKEIELRAASRQLLPELELSAGLKSAHLTHQSNLGAVYPFERRTEERWGYEVGVKFSYPIGNDVARADHRRKLLELDKLRLELQQQQVVIQRDLATAAVGVESAKEVIDASSKALALQEKNVDAGRLRLQFGLATIRDLIDIQTAYVNASLRHVGALADYQKATVNFHRAQGSVDPRYGLDVTAEYPTRP